MCPPCTADILAALHAMSSFSCLFEPIAFSLHSFFTAGKNQWQASMRLNCLQYFAQCCKKCFLVWLSCVHAIYFVICCIVFGRLIISQSWTIIGQPSLLPINVYDIHWQNSNVNVLRLYTIANLNRKKNPGSYRGNRSTLNPFVHPLITNSRYIVY